MFEGFAVIGAREDSLDIAPGSTGWPVLAYPPWIMATLKDTDK